MRDFMQWITDHFTSACRHMDPEQLTNDERFSIAVMAGANFKTAWNHDVEGRLSVTYTTDPVHVNLTSDGRWKVFVIGPREHEVMLQPQKFVREVDEKDAPPAWHGRPDGTFVIGRLCLSRPPEIAE